MAADESRLLVNSEPKSLNDPAELRKRVDMLRARWHPAINPHFVHSLVVALQVGFACACAIPATWLMPHDWEVWQSILPNVIPAIVLTVNLTLSTTVLHSLKSLEGVCLAVGNAGLLSLLPNGWTGFAMLDFAVFSFVILWLNLHIKTKVIAMSLAPVFVMKYAHPTKEINFHGIFREELKATLFFQVLGVGLAILAVLLPTPQFAFVELKKVGAGAARETAEFLSEVTSYQLGTERSLAVHLLKSRMKRWTDLVERMSDLSDEAWYEGFDLGCLGLHRTAAKRLSIVLERTRRSFHVLEKCAEKEEFSELHTRTMQPMAEELKNLCADVTNLIYASASSIFELKRKVTDAKGELEELADRVTWSQQQVIEQWVTSRNKNTEAGMGLQKELRTENFFVLTISHVASRLVAFARSEVALTGAETKVRVGMQDFQAIFSWKVLSNPSHLNFVLRNFLSVNFAFLLGLFLYEYDSSMAVFVALMMSLTPGAALTKNLGRMQGTVLGMLVCNILFVFFHVFHCHWMFQCTVIFLFEAVTHFIYFYSATYGHIGCLLAIFGGKVLIVPCTGEFSHKEMETRDVAAYHSFYMLALALGIITAVDLLLFSKPASAMARDRILRAMESAIKQFSSFMYQGHAAVQSREQKSEAVSVDLCKAMVLCSEAEQEPRWHKAPFRVTLFTLLAEKLTLLNSHLQVLQEGFERADEDLWGVVSTQPGFEQMRAVIIDYLQRMESLVRAVLEHETCDAMDMASLGNKGELLKDLKIAEGYIEQLVTECRDFFADRLRHREPAEKAESDIACRLCVIFSMFEELTYDISSIIICAAKRL